MISARRLPSFEYLAPKAVEEACSLLVQYAEAKVMAGGTDLLAMMKKREIVPNYLIGLRNIPGLGSGSLASNTTG